MAPVIPREFLHGLPLEGLSFPLEPMVELAPFRGGKNVSLDLGPALWRMSYRSTQMEPEEAEEALAWYASILSNGAFYAYNKLRQYPRNYPNGFGGLTVGGSAFTGYGAISSVAANRVDLSLKLLPNGFVLKNGDMLAFDYAARTAVTTPRLGVDNLYSIGCPHKIVTAFASATIRVRRGSDSTEKDFTPSGTGGWLLSSQLQAWSPGDTFFCRTLYDQSGNSRPWEQSTAGSQPIVNTDGVYVYLQATDAARYLSATSAGAFAQNIGAFSWLTIAAAASGISNNAAVLKIATDTAANPRSMVRYLTGTNAWEFVGRRQDADSTTSAGNVVSALGDWDMLLARVDQTNNDFFFSVDTGHGSNTSFLTGGSTSNTASAEITFGASPNGATGFRGNMMAVALIRDLVTQGERDTILAAFAALKPSAWPSPSRALHRVTVAATADGSGNATVSVAPYIRTGWEAEAGVNFYRPACLAKIVPGTYQENAAPPNWTTLSFDAIQTL